MRKRKGHDRPSKAISSEQTAQLHEDQFKKAPHSFVFNRGHVGKNVGELVHDLRRVMEPYTASTMKVRRRNVLKDFINIAGPLNVSHFMMLSKTDVSTNLRILRLPRGPTMSFKVRNYSLVRDVVSSLKNPHMHAKQFQQHPLLVMNNFSGEGMHLKLMATMFQNMFPSINVTKVQLKSIRRCVLLNYDPETKTVEFRHYNIRVTAAGISKGLKKLIKPKLPDLSKYEDVSEFFMKAGDLSESEAELDGGANEIVLPQDINSVGTKSSKCAIRLSEIGPRMTLQLEKIEEGVCDGKVLYHEFIQKTEEEMKILEDVRERKRLAKQKRQKQQELNIKRKEEKKEVHKKRSLAGMKQTGGDDVEEPEAGAGNDGEYEDDREYYEREVGEKADPELFPQRKFATTKRKADDTSSRGQPFKKKKQDTTDKGNKKSVRFQMDEKPNTKFGKNRMDRFSKSQSKDKFSKDDKNKDGKNKDKQQKDKKPMTDMDRILRRKKLKEKKLQGKVKKRSRNTKGKPAKPKPTADKAGDKSFKGGKSFKSGDKSFKGKPGTGKFGKGKPAMGKHTKAKPRKR